MPTLSAEIKGLREVQKKMIQVVRDLSGLPMLNAMRDATLLVERSGRINAPVDTGRLRASIVPEVVTRGSTIQGIVGSNVRYAPFQEFGTRKMRGRFYLRNAIESNRQRIHEILSRAVGYIVNRS